MNVSTLTVKTSLSSLTNTPTVTFNSSNSRNITIRKLLGTVVNSTVLPQNLTITFFNLINPSSAKVIGDFIVKTYYNEDYTEKVSESVISSSLMTVSGQIK